LLGWGWFLERVLFRYSVAATTGHTPIRPATSSWFAARQQGDEDAKKNITELESKLTPEQIAEGQKLARDFKPR